MIFGIAIEAEASSGDSFLVIARVTRGQVQAALALRVDRRVPTLGRPPALSAAVLVLGVRIGRLADVSTIVGALAGRAGGQISTTPVIVAAAPRLASRSGRSGRRGYAQIALLQGSHDIPSVVLVGQRRPRGSCSRVEMGTRRVVLDAFAAGQAEQTLPHPTIEQTVAEEDEDGLQDGAERECIEEDVGRVASREDGQNPDGHRYGQQCETQPNQRPASTGNPS